MESDRFQVVIDHLVRVSQEVTEIKFNQQHFSEELAELKANQQQFSEKLTRVENDHGQKLQALFDARQVQLEVNDRILSALTRIENKLDNLSIKVAHHDLLLKKDL